MFTFHLEAVADVADLSASSAHPAVADLAKAVRAAGMQVRCMDAAECLHMHLHACVHLMIMPAVELGAAACQQGHMPAARFYRPAWR